MDKERKFILCHRYISLGVGVLCFAIFLFLRFYPVKNPKIIDDACYINDYYEYSNTTSLEVTVTFDCAVDSGYITVAFYDVNESFIEQKTSYFFSDYVDKETLSATFYVYGEVEYYEITSHEITSTTNYETLYVTAKFLHIIGIIAIIYFLITIQLKYKKYEYKGNIISVYAGFYKHYLLINGVKYDEQNTSFQYTPIVFSCAFSDESVVTATISTSHSISLKINNRLYTNVIK